MRKEVETALARSPTENKKTVKPNTCKDKRKLVQRFNALFQARRPWERVWKLIRDYELPYDGLFDTTKKSLQASFKKQEIPLQQAFNLDLHRRLGVGSVLASEIRTWPTIQAFNGS